jgi:membrane protein DedA with SNARE-associated domain
MFDAITISKYGGILATLILAGFGLPIPEEIPIVTAGARVGHDALDVADATRIDDALAAVGAVGGGAALNFPPDPPSGLTRWWLMLLVCIVGVVVGDSVIYLAGRLWGRKLMRSGWVQRHVLPPDKQIKIEENFHKNGILILLGARLTPGVRTPVFLMAGILKMPVSRFLFADGLYAIPGVNLLFWLSYLFTDQFVALIGAVERHRSMVIVAVFAAVGGVIAYKLLFNRKLATGDVKEIPTVVRPVGVVTQAVEQALERAAHRTAQTIPRVVDKVAHPLGAHAKPAAPEANGQPAPAEAKSAEPAVPVSGSTPAPG